MSKLLIRRWINLLKSEKFTPCKGKLRIGNKRCPIGILCEAYSPLNWEYSIEDDTYYYLGESERVPQEISKLVPLSEKDWEKIIVANDLGVANFYEIADFVRRKLL